VLIFEEKKQNALPGAAAGAAGSINTRIKKDP